MTYQFVFLEEPQLIIPAVIMDARASIPQVKNQSGTVIKGYTDQEVAKATEVAVVPFKIEVIETAVLAGYFTFKVGPPVELYQFQLRPAFEAFINQISQQSATFIQQDNWRMEVLL